MGLVFVTFLPNLPTETLAHTDGCHRWHSCPSDDGSYICGDLGYDDECGGSVEEEDEDTDGEEDTGSSIDDNDNSASSSDGDGSDSGSEGNTNDREQVISSSTECQGQADCFRGTVTDIVDGDTLDVNNVRIRLSLVNTPERGDSGYSEAKEFTESMCPIGSEALVDEDDGQKEGSFDRVIGLVYCGGNEKLLLNEHLLEEEHAQIFVDFCGISEFSEEEWIQKYGC